MYDIFEEMFVNDINSDNFSQMARKNKNVEKDDKIYHIFWDSLSDEQKQKYCEFEKVLFKDDLENEKAIYNYALKKGLVLGFSIAKLVLSE